MEREQAWQWTAIVAEAINMTTQKEGCVCVCMCVLRQGVSDNRYKDTTEQRKARHLRSARHQLLLELSLTFVRARAPVSRSQL